MGNWRFVFVGNDGSHKKKDIFVSSLKMSSSKVLQVLFSEHLAKIKLFSS